MKKKPLVMAFLSVMLLAAHSQTIAPTKNQTNFYFLGHNIHVFKTGTGYGYDISYQNHLWMHQSNNPFTADRNGLAKEEDALKLARWQVVHFRQSGTRPLANANNTLPKGLAGQLKISTN